MFGTTVRRLVVAAWVVSCAGTLAWAGTASATVLASGVSQGAGQGQPVLVEDAVVDARSGLTISVERRAAGTVSVNAVGHGLDVRKTVAPDGAFTFTIAGGADVLTVAGRAGAVVVSRGVELVTIDIRRPDAGAFSRAAGLLAGSPALRLFRGAVSRLGPDIRETVGGTALEIGDVLLRVIQDDPGAVERLRDGRLAAGGALVRVGHMRKPCYGDWEEEVLAAWGDYEGCYSDFSWWSGGREVCAMVYVIRAEAAWFQFLTCVGFRAQ